MGLLQIHEPGESPDPHDRQAVIGIDLGTTNSVVSTLKNDKPVALENSAGKSIIPSAVHYGKQTVVGDVAFEQAAQHGQYPVQSIKKLMGRSSDEAVNALPLLADCLTSDGQEVPHYKFGEHQCTPISVSADILLYLKEMATATLEQNVEKAVITVPAYFDDAARQATRQAASLAGLDVLRLINEPTAAALAYGLEHAKEGVYGVYDLGGGTFDISILNLEKGVFQVLSTAGDVALGGDDIDVAVANYLAGEFCLTDVDPAALQTTARYMKQALSELDHIDEELGDVMVSLDREALHRIAAPFIQRSITICQQAIEDANIDLDALHGVVLVGGSTRLAAVRDAVSSYFDCPVFDDLDPDRVVSYGAAIQADALVRGGEHLLLDVTPLSLGLETMGGIVEKLIYRNTPVPAEASQEFTTYQDGQTGMQIHVLQGERELVDQCRSLAQFELTGIPPLPAGIARIEVKFMIDADGLLTVTACEQETGVSQSVDVKPSYGLPIETIEKMIVESMEHGRDDIMQRLLVEARVDAVRTVEETRSAINMDEELLEASDAAHIQAAIECVEDAVSSDDRAVVESAHDALKKVIEPFAERRMNAAVQKALAGNRVSDM